MRRMGLWSGMGSGLEFWLVSLLGFALVPESASGLEFELAPLLASGLESRLEFPSELELAGRLGLFRPDCSTGFRWFGRCRFFLCFGVPALLRFRRGSGSRRRGG